MAISYERKAAGSAGRLAAAWCTQFTVGTDLFVIAPLLPMIGRDLGLSPAASGLSVTVFAVTYMLCAPFWGRTADRLGRRIVLTGCLLGFAGANLLTALAPSLAWLLAGRIVAGAATAGVSPSVYALVGDSAPPARRATWMAIAVSGLLCSLSFGAPLGTLAAAKLGWNWVFAALAVLGLALVPLNLRIWPPDAAAPAAIGGRAAGFALRLARRLLPTLVWSTALYAIYTYLGVWLTRAGFAPAAVAQVIACYGGGALVGTLAGGRLADRVGARAAMAASLLGLFVMFLLVSLALSEDWLVGPGFAVASAVAQVFFPAQQAALVAAFPERRATALAWNNSALFCGIACGSLLGGQFVAHAGFATALTLCAAIALAGAAVGWIVVPARVALRGPGSVVAAQ